MTEGQMADLHLFVDGICRLAQTEPQLEPAAREVRKALYALQGLLHCSTCGRHIPAESVCDDGIPYCAICYVRLEQPIANRGLSWDVLIDTMVDVHRQKKEEEKSA